MDSFAISRTGYKKRVNEDSFGGTVSADGLVKFLVVSDGMGGHLAGDVASRMTVDGICAAASKYTYGGVEHLREFLTETVVSVDSDITKHAANDILCKNMGATLVLLAVIESENNAVVCNVGDSRCYHFDGGRLLQVTRDHSVAQLMIEKGYTPEETRKYLFNNAVTKAMGFLAKIGCTEPDCYEVEHKRGDIFLLCSDGLSAAVDPVELYSVISDNSGKRMDRMCEALVYTALGCGSEDDITVAAVKM